MRKLFKVITDGGEKIDLRLKRDDETLRWTIDEIAPDFGCKPDNSEPPNYNVGDWLYHIRDKYVFEVKSANEFFLTSDDEKYLNVVYCRPATEKEIHIHTLELMRRYRKTAHEHMSYKEKLTVHIKELERDGFGHLTHLSEIKRIVDNMTGNEK